MKVSAVLHILRQFSKKIVQVQAFFILTMLYFVVLPFFAFILKIVKRKTYNTKNTWEPWRCTEDTIADLKKQF